MTDTQRANISKGRRKSIQRKRMSEAMKASWRRRRNRKAQLELTLSEPQNNEIKACVNPDKVFDMAIRVLGYDKVAHVLKQAITKELESWLK